MVVYSSVHAVIIRRLRIGQYDQESLRFTDQGVPHSLYHERRPSYTYLDCDVTLTLLVSADGNGIAVTVIANSMSFRMAM